MVELGSGFSLPCPDGRVPESLALQCISSDFDMALLPVLSAAIDNAVMSHLPVLSTTTANAMTQIILVGKAVMKEMYLKFI